MPEYIAWWSCAVNICRTFCYSSSYIAAIEAMAIFGLLDIFYALVRPELVYHAAVAKCVVVIEALKT